MPPVFQNVAPDPSFSILPGTPVQFDIVDSGSSLVLVVPVIILDPTVAGELVYDWVAQTFAAAYAQQSTIEAITNGYRFTIRRLYGWATPPTLRAFAVDAAGAIASL